MGGSLDLGYIEVPRTLKPQSVRRILKHPIAHPIVIFRYAVRSDVIGCGPPISLPPINGVPVGKHEKRCLKTPPCENQQR